MNPGLQLVPPVSVSDNYRDQILRKTPFPASVLARVEIVFRSVFVTKNASVHDIDFAELESRLVSGSQCALRLVTLRTPKAHRPHDHVPDYILVYVVETLECGHSLTVYPQGDPLIAKRRLCPACEELISALPPKKPCKSVGSTFPKAGAA
jgi:hypothetical protein